ncbi:MAG: hypothetical protein A3J80_09050 [Desulfobacula sp. RIFOXYB2_FULL_45_6]|nr:MAG: hypothetical protein A3J80_09050 [Desulfobacula sp. RIFOXYB2_FULL_45_6]
MSNLYCLRFYSLCVLKKRYLLICSDGIRALKKKAALKNAFLCAVVHREGLRAFFESGAEKRNYAESVNPFHR